MPNIAANARDDPDRQFASDQDRPLLDMQFDPGRHAARIEQRIALCYAFDIRAHIAHAIRQRASSHSMGRRKVVRRESPE